MISRPTAVKLEGEVPMRSFPRQFFFIMLAALVSGVSTTAAARAAGPARPLSPNPGHPNILEGVSSVSATDAWAVGDYKNRTTLATDTLILQWDGAHWSRVKSPSPSHFNLLFGVSADSANDAWAVGLYHDISTGISRSLILHWNGAAWSKVHSPNPGNGGDLRAVSADSANDAWAVGTYQDISNRTRTLLLHWNGTAWSKVKSPTRGRRGYLFDVSADSPTDAWAVGQNSKLSATLILHWNGTAWSKVHSPTPPGNAPILLGVSAGSADDAWAAGTYQDISNRTRTLLLHWNGTAWSKVKGPTRGRNGVLGDVSGDSPTDAWAVGWYCSDVCRTLTLHWNGTAWTRIKSPSPRSGDELHLRGVSVRSGTDAWAAGAYQNNTTGEWDTLILHWNGTAWAKT